MSFNPDKNLRKIVSIFRDLSKLFLLPSMCKSFIFTSTMGLTLETVMRFYVFVSLTAKRIQFILYFISFIEILTQKSYMNSFSLQLHSKMLFWCNVVILSFFMYVQDRAMIQLSHHQNLLQSKVNVSVYTYYGFLFTPRNALMNTILHKM